MEKDSRGESPEKQVANPVRRAVQVWEKEERHWAKEEEERRGRLEAREEEEKGGLPESAIIVRRKGTCYGIAKGKRKMCSGSIALERDR